MFKKKNKIKYFYIFLYNICKMTALVTHRIQVCYTFMHRGEKKDKTSLCQQAFWQMLLPSFALGCGPAGEGHGKKKKACRRRGASAGAARWRRCRSSSPLVLLSFLGSARPELAVCWVRSLPDTRLRDLTFTERKSREWGWDTERGPIRCHRRGKASWTTVSCLGSPVYTTEGWTRGLIADTPHHHHPAGFELVVGCGLVLTAVIVLLPPPPPPPPPPPTE